MTRDRPPAATRWCLLALGVALLLAAPAAAATASAGGADASVTGPAAGGTDDPATLPADAVPAAGLHGNHVSTDAQVVSDGTVLVESLFLIEAGFLVIRADDDGGLGDPIGSVYVESGFTRSVAVETNASFWADREGPVTLHAALHADDGDREFEYREDDLLRSPATGRATSSFGARRGEESAYVSARTFSGQRIAEPSVTVSRAALPADGSVAVHAATEELGVGDRLGSRDLSAGTHENVSVPLASGYLESLPYEDPTRLWVTVHADGEPVSVGDDPVRTLITVRRVNESSVDDEWEINTPVPTTEPPADPTTEPPTDGVTETPTATGTDAADGGSPGLGVPAALGVLAATVLFAVGRRERS